MRSNFVSKCLIAFLFVVGTGLLHPANAGLQSIAFHYGANAPLDELHAFEVAVVDPDHGFDPVAYRSPVSELFAYVSVGEVHPSRPYASQIAPDWRLGSNTAWGSIVVDQRKEVWRQFFVQQVVAPLWAKGYRGLFLDTLDSYQLGGDKADAAAQQAGLVALIRAVRKQFPGIRLILNRGFELLPQLAGEIEAVAAESLFRGWDANRKVYREVPQQDRAWLLEKLNEVHERYGISVIAIDYVPPTNRVLMRDTASRIRAQGFVPWVSDGALLTLGVSNAEVIPHRILIVYDNREAPGIHYRTAHRYLEMPLNYLGYVANYVDVNGKLDAPDPGLYAGIVSWFEGELSSSSARRYSPWLAQRVSEGWRLAMFGNPGLPLTKENLSPLGLVPVAAPAGKVSVIKQESGVGYEGPPVPQRGLIIPLKLAEGAGKRLAVPEG